MTNYTLTTTTTILRDDGAHIPPDPMNRDYAEYLTWVAEGNTPAPYVVPPAPPLTATPLQFRLGLSNAGLRSQVETWVQTASQKDQDAYKYASIFVETDPLIVDAAAALGISLSQVHTVFQSMQSLSP